MEVREELPIPALILNPTLLIFYLMVWVSVREVKVGIVQEAG